MRHAKNEKRDLTNRIELQNQENNRILREKEIYE